MPKFSQIPTNASPAVGDYVVGVTTGGVDDRITIAQLAALVSANLTAASVKKATIDYTSVDVYSATEQDTGKKWVDGRTIYRKVLTGNVTVAAGNNAIAHGITGITALEVVHVGYTIRLSSTSRGSSLNLAWHREAGGNWSNPVAMDATSFSVYSSFAWGASAYTAILEYVK